MIPVIALVGRPNVGKSTLFNLLTASRQALVADFPGLTRDRIYGVGRMGPCPFIVVDTGGITQNSSDLDHSTARQTQRAIGEADVILLLTDAQEGLTAGDEEIATHLRTLGKSVVVIVNKADRVNPDWVGAEFHALGLGVPEPISALRGSHVRETLERVLAPWVAEAVRNPLPAIEDNAVRVAIVGRPNVGKSTLVNRLLGEERMVASPIPGTTRDAVEVPFEYENRPFRLIDTAGVRRRSRVDDMIEKFSVVKAIEAIERAQVVILVMDAQEGLYDQDLHLLGHIVHSGKALLIAVNKWDGLDKDKKQTMHRALDRKLAFIDYAEIQFISALHGTGVGHLFELVTRAFESATRELKTPQLTELLADAVIAHTPPLVHGRRIKLRYAHQGGRNPPVIVIHGNQTQHVPETYTRYLCNYYRAKLKLIGTPVLVHYKTSENPFRHKKNILTQRQVRKRQRLVSHMRRK